MNLMEQNLQLMLLTAIVVLICANAIVFFSTVMVRMRRKLEEYQFRKAYAWLSTHPEAYLDTENAFMTRYSLPKKKTEKKVILQLLLKGPNDVQEKLAQKLNQIGYLDMVVLETAKEPTLENIQLLSKLKSAKAFPVLMQGTKTNDYDLQFNCFYAISLLKLNTNEAETYAEALLQSEILRGRQIDMLNNLELPPDGYLQLLKKQQTEEGKAILFRVMENRFTEKDQEKTDRLVEYLKDEKEVRISAVLFFTSTLNSTYTEMLGSLYKNEEAWEVRAAIARYLCRLKHPDVVSLTKQMAEDSAWWVRRNAAEALLKLGVEGEYALRDLYQNSLNEDVSVQAYSTLMKRKGSTVTGKGNGEKSE